MVLLSPTKEYTVLIDDIACSAITAALLYSSNIFLASPMRILPYINPGIIRTTTEGNATKANLHSNTNAVM
uniref:Uncharacterized protein n=1 Tax=Nymphaea colorata TaxID=210225 RepID=A0A5K1BKW2_9MAGN